MQIYDVGGMTCEHCRTSVEQAVRRLDPNAAVTVDLVAGEVRVQGVADAEAIVAAIGRAGYPARLRR